MALAATAAAVVQSCRVRSARLRITVPVVSLTAPDCYGRPKNTFQSDSVTLS